MPTETTSAKLKRFIKHLSDNKQHWSNDIEVTYPAARGEDPITKVTVTHWGRRPSGELEELHKTAFATGAYVHSQDEPLLRALVLAFGEPPALPESEE